MAEPLLYARHAERRLTEAAEDSPVVLIHGPRQCGKTTLAQLTFAPGYLTWKGSGVARSGSHEPRSYTYISFDDEVARIGARVDPVGFVADLPERVILDEIQLVPELFPAIKMAVDRNRENGRFILTGSSNVLLIPNLSESLAGRMQILRLYPLSQLELENKLLHSDAYESSGFLNRLFSIGFEIQRTERLGEQLIERMVTGGFPPAVVPPTLRRRANWYRSYVETLIERDVRESMQISSLDSLRRLLSAIASQTARLFNISNLASPFQLSRPTIKAYVEILERMFLVEQLPPWHRNNLKRLIKTPKLHVGDTGLAAAVLGLSAQAIHADGTLLGQLSESFVFQELRKQASWQDTPTRFSHFRDRDDFEVDIVLERDSGTLCGIEVKASATVTQADFRGLRKLSQAAGERFLCGVVLYDGELSVRFGKGFYAVPIRWLWES